MGQTQSRTADFAGVIPGRASTKTSVATNSIQPQCQQPRAPLVSCAGKATPAVTQLGQLPAHSIVRDAIGDEKGRCASLKTPPLSGLGESAPLSPRCGVVDDNDDYGVITSRPPVSLYAEPESVRKARVLDEHSDVCSEIIDGFLFVSNLRVARDRAVLDALSITHVVDCCAELSGGDPEVDDDKLQRLRLALRDDTREDLTPFLLFQIVPFIAQCRQEQLLQLAAGGAGPKVLVHCHQGVSRSCAVAIAFVMADRTTAFREAAALVKQRRAISSPNAAFLCQLIQWGRDLDAFLASESDPRVLSGFYRLTPHAAHDPHTLVLKKCSDDLDESSFAEELWSRGVFVFQRPRDGVVVIWTGAKCGIEEGPMVARRLVENAARAKSFAATAACGTTRSTASGASILPTIVDVRGLEENDGRRFEYADELQWVFDDAATSSQLQEPADDAGNEASTIKHIGQGEVSDAAKVSGSALEVAATPLLFVLESLNSGESAEDSTGEWDQLKQYDVEDLTSHDVFLLVLASAGRSTTATSSPDADVQRRLECFVWIGADSSMNIQLVVAAARHHLASMDQLAYRKLEAPCVTIEWQNSESDRFWHVFELGY